MLRVLIVEDSLTSSLLLKTILESDPAIQVVGTAQDGIEGLQKALELRPDLITMDIHMPGQDGFETTRQIMARVPTPIVIVSASADASEVRLSMQSLEAGALAIIPKPSGPQHPRFKQQAEELIHTVKTMADVKVVGRRSPVVRLPKSASRLPAFTRPLELIAIAASTGGPAALTAILSGLPKPLPIPILIVQHIAAGFDRGLVEWLASVSGQPVRLARQNELLEPGQVLMAPQGVHLGVDERRQVTLDHYSPPLGGFRPSATYLFSSIARVYGARALGVTLTGMGVDGAAGLLELHQAGGRVLAQDEASCVVFGMPAAALALGAVDQIVPLLQIAAILAELETEAIP